jgi:hypothetical protein
MESAPMISPLNRSATSMAAAVLPTAVGPQMTRTGGFEEIPGCAYCVRWVVEVTLDLRIETGNLKLEIR